MSLSFSCFSKEVSESFFNKSKKEGLKNIDYNCLSEQFSKLFNRDVNFSLASSKWIESKELDIVEEGDVVFRATFLPTEAECSCVIKKNDFFSLIEEIVEIPKIEIYKDFFDAFNEYLLFDLKKIVASKTIINGSSTNIESCYDLPYIDMWNEEINVKVGKANFNINLFFNGYFLELFQQEKIDMNFDLNIIVDEFKLSMDEYRNLSLGDFLVINKNLGKEVIDNLKLKLDDKLLFFAKIDEESKLLITD